MKSLTIVFAILFLGLTALGQTQNVTAGGLFQLDDTQALCGLPVSVPSLASARTLPLPTEVAMCRVAIVQNNAPVRYAELSLAWTEGFLGIVGGTVIRGVIPANLQMGPATLYVQKMMHVATPDGKGYVSVLVSEKAYQVNVAPSTGTISMAATCPKDTECFSVEVPLSVYVPSTTWYVSGEISRLKE